MAVFSFDQLPGRMDKLSRVIPKVGTKLVRATATAIGATVVDTTAVDTGRARSNWQASLNAPAAERPPYAPGSKLGIGETANANAAKAQQRQIINTFDARKHDRVVISNFVEYIGFINNGGQFIRPHLMVEQGLQSGRAVLQTIRALDERDFR